MLTSKQSLKILLIEDDPVYVELIEDLLGSVSHTQFKLKAVQRLGEGLKCLDEAFFDAILLDLSLPDSFGIDTIVSVKMQASATPIVVLTALNDRDVAIEAVRAGAQDYLMKGQFQRELLVRSISYSIERQRTEDALRQLAERERLLGRTIERVRQSIDLTEILQTTVAEVRHFLKTDRVLIYRCQLSEIETTFDEQPASAIAGDVGAFEEDVWKPEVYANFLMSCLESEDFQYLHAVENVKTAELNSEYKNLLTDFQVRAVLMVPIWQTRTQRASLLSPIENRLWGLLMAHNCSECRQWQQWEIDFLKQLASQVAIAIQQSQLYRQLEIANQKLLHLASTDALTGIANRRQFERVLKQEWQRLAQERSPMSLILCDIDFFKLYNDTMGHLAGDECLQRVANLIASSVQFLADEAIRVPLVARYGGEEFAAIFPNTDSACAIDFAEKLRQQIETLQIPHPTSPINPYVTLSWGVTSTIPNLDRSPDTLIQVADGALYQAKAQGKNCICQARYNFPS